MTPIVPTRQLPPNVHGPLVLLIEDDPSVLQVLQIALQHDYFRVITAVDGDEAIRRACAERPDVIVCDVKLPRRGGLEVCDHLRHDPEDPQVPILLISASADTEARLEGLSRGADDYLSKPFSPKELIARIHRLLSRATETRALRTRTRELERDLGRSHDEVRRANLEMKREQRLRELAFGAGRDLQRSLDLDELHERVLRSAQQQLGAGSVALLALEPVDPEAAAAFVLSAFRGATGERFAHLSLPVRSELAALLGGLGRPVARIELERFPELRAELPPFIAAGAGWFAPLRGPHGLHGVLIAEERTDGRPLEAGDREALAALCEFAGPALVNARRYRLAQDRVLELLAERSWTRDEVREAAHESCALAELGAQLLRLPARERELVRHAVAFGAWGWGEAAERELSELERHDATRRVTALRALIRRGEALDPGEDGSLAAAQAALVVAVCVRHLVGRVSGRSVGESWETALAWAGPHLDPATRQALEAAHARVFTLAA